VKLPNLATSALRPTYDRWTKQLRKQGVLGIDETSNKQAGEKAWLWTFVDVEGVEPTNNASERALRHGVIWRKLSFGAQSESGSRFVETILTIIETCRQQSRNVVDFVTQLVENHFAAPIGV
jgi:hypothetical protein